MTSDVCDKKLVTPNCHWIFDQYFCLPNLTTKPTVPVIPVHLIDRMSNGDQKTVNPDQ